MLPPLHFPHCTPTACHALLPCGAESCTQSMHYSFMEHMDAFEPRFTALWSTAQPICRATPTPRFRPMWVPEEPQLKLSPSCG